VGAGVICWLVDLQFCLPLENFSDCSCKLGTQRRWQLFQISEIQARSEEIRVVHGNSISQTQAIINGPVADKVTEGLATCLKVTVLSDHHWENDEPSGGTRV